MATAWENRNVLVRSLPDYDLSDQEVQTVVSFFTIANQDKPVQVASLNEADSKDGISGVKWPSGAANCLRMTGVIRSAMSQVHALRK